MTLYDGRAQILFPGGKLGFIAVSMLFTVMAMYFLKENSLKFAIGFSIVLASSLIFIDNDLNDSEWRKTPESSLVSFNDRLARGNRYNLNQSEWKEYNDIKTFLTQYEQEKI